MLLLLAVTAGIVGVQNVDSLLYPRQTATRSVLRLDGVWKFRTAATDYPDEGFDNKWYTNDWDKMDLSYEPMPVPASYNDIGQNPALRDHVGWVWYQTSFYVPDYWKAKRIVLYFGSVHYKASVFVNGMLATEHNFGHLPFEVELAGLLKAESASPNLLTVAVSNILTNITIPQGTLSGQSVRSNRTYYRYNDYRFDFFNYAGIHRGVFVYATAHSYVSDVHVHTLITEQSGAVISYEVKRSGVWKSSLKCHVSIRDRKGKVVHSSPSVCAGNITLTDAKLWWPHTHSKQPGYLYTLEANVFDDHILVDSYPLKFGIRSVEINGTRFLLNGRDFYFTGFGKHEDFDVRGRGLDNAWNVKDMNMVKWLGANSIRTSHYPNSEELMDLADEMGIAVIDETPAVSLSGFSDQLLQFHKQIITDLISRDKNRPSVFMWSVANEPFSEEIDSEKYFREVVAHVKSLDGSRPVTAALATSSCTDKAGQFMDVIMFNQYFGWYKENGRLDNIYSSVIDDSTSWNTFLSKPVMIAEYGAGAVAGIHASPSWPFSEDYQSELFIKHHGAFDDLRTQGWFIGEHVWVFADFMTRQGYTRVHGNKKGILTRQRQPKAAAKLLRCRYYSLAGIAMDDDAFYCPARRSHKATSCRAENPDDVDIEVEVGLSVNSVVKL